MEGSIDDRSNGYEAVASEHIARRHPSIGVSSVRAWARSLSGTAVLDLGCGRGAVLLMASGRLTTGRAVGIDRWRKTDQSGNAAAATRRNAVAEGVADRVDLCTADFTALPFGDQSFDLVLSSVAIHNVKRTRAATENAQLVDARAAVRSSCPGSFQDQRYVARPN